MQQNKQYGFSLIELMIVLAIIGVLAKIAYPSYQDSMIKSRRADAKSALLELSVFMERLYTTTGCYNAGSDKTCNTADDTTASASSPNLSVLIPYYRYNSSGTWTGEVAAPKSGGAINYNLSLSNVTASAFTLQAVPVTKKPDEKCGTLTLDNTGVKTESGSGTVADCW
jgi:type IV pilus assembly protein PilE